MGDISLIVPRWKPGVSRKPNWLAVTPPAWKMLNGTQPAAIGLPVMVPRQTTVEPGVPGATTFLFASTATASSAKIRRLTEKSLK